MGILVSTDHLIATSEARKQMAKLIDNIQTDEKNYYVILENGKVAAVLVHPKWLEEKFGEQFPSLEEVRSGWNRYDKEAKEAIEKLQKTDRKNLPALLR